LNYYAPNLISICVDYVNYPEFGGSIYHCHSPSAVKFNDIIQLIAIMEDFFDSLKIPQASNKLRSFTRRSTKPQRLKNEVLAMSIQDIRKKRGGEGTFIVHVQYRQNTTWQGNVFWAEKNVTRNFRSALELLKLIDSAFDDGSGHTFIDAEPDGSSGKNAE